VLLTLSVPGGTRPCIVRDSPTRGKDNRLDDRLS